MRSYLLTAAIFFLCSSFLKINYPVGRAADPKDLMHKNVFDFTVHRLSGERVVVSWHTKDESDKMIYEVLRKHRKTEPFSSLGVVQPKSREDNSADYSFVDVNDFLDSSYYCLKKTNADSIVFYSITKGIEGVGKER